MEPQDAGRVEFRVTGIDEGSLPRRQQSRRGWSRIAVPVLATAAIAAASSAPTMSDARGNAGAGAANDAGAVVRGDRVLILADDSGSMAGNPTRVRDEQVASLRRTHDVLGDTVLTGGWAISLSRGSYSFLQPLENALTPQRDVESIYFISDFAAGDDADNDVEGLTRLRTLLRERGLRLYLSTANLPVPAAYAQLAVESGGLVLSR